MNRWWILLPALGAAIVLAGIGGPESGAAGTSALVPTTRTQASTTRAPVTANGAVAAVAVAAANGGDSPAEAGRPPIDRGVLYPASSAEAARDLFASRAHGAANASSTPSAPGAASAASAADRSGALTILGRQFDGHAWEVYLAHGDDVLIVRAGDVLPNNVKVLAIDDDHMKLSDASGERVIDLGGAQ